MQAPFRLMAMRWLVSCLALLAAAGALADPRIDQARTEGEVVWYTAMNVPDTDALRTPFVERYPFLKLTVLRATGEKVRTRILTEARAKRFAWDIVSFNLLDMDALATEGLLAAYRSAEAATGYAPGALDPVVTSPSQVAISARAPHPAAARLFVDFLLSSEGQALIRSRGRVPARTGIDAGTEALKVHYVDPRLAAQFNRYEKEFREIFGRVP